MAMYRCNICNTYEYDSTRGELFIKLRQDYGIAGEENAGG